jgi:hypothetical protein
VLTALRTPSGIPSRMCATKTTSTGKRSTEQGITSTFKVQNHPRLLHNPLFCLAFLSQISQNPLLKFFATDVVVTSKLDSKMSFFKQIHKTKCGYTCPFFFSFFCVFFPSFISLGTSTSTSSPSPPKIAVVLNSFTPEPLSVEIPLVKGTLVTILQAGDTEDWWEGEVEGNSGYFPKTFVQILVY